MKENRINGFKEDYHETGIDLPQVLKVYKMEDFAIQLKVRFFYHLSYALVGSLIFLISYTIYLQLTNPIYGKLYFPVLIPEFCILIVAFICLFLLIRGYFGISSHLLVIVTIMATWTGIWMDRGDTLSRLDSIAFILAVITIMPLLIKRKLTLVLYVFVNIALMFTYILYYKEKINLPVSSAIDFLADTSISLIFIGIVGYNIYKIHKKVLSKAIFDLNEKHKVEKTLLESEKKYTDMTDLLPQSVFETDANGSLLYLNKTGIETFQFKDEDKYQGVNIFSFIVPEETEKAIKNFNATLNGKIVDTNRFHLYRKDGFIFPAQIYSKAFEITNQIRGIRGIIVDITQQEISEKAIIESESKYRALMESMSEMIIVTDNENVVQYVNNQFTEKLGYQPEEILGKKGYLTLQDPKDFSKVEQATSERINNLSSSYELAFKAKNGNKFDFLVSGAPYKNSDGVIIGSIESLMDITERKKVEKELQESEERFKILSSIASEGLMIHEKGFIVDLNQTFAKILGQENAADLIGKEAIEAIPFTPESKHIVYEHFKSKSDETFDVEIIKQDGKIVPAETRGTEIDYKGRKANLVYMRDISDRKKAELDLKESEERYKKLIEAFPDIIMVSDLNGNIIFANEPLERITGILPADYNNPKRVAHIHPDDYSIVQEALNDLLNSNKNFTDIIENRFIDSWGNVHWFSGILAKTYFEGKLLIQEVSRDITEKKVIEFELEKYRNQLEIIVKERTEELASTNEELKITNEKLFNQKEKLQITLDKLNKAQNQLIQSEKMASLGILSAGIAHEINNPLNFINSGITGLETYFTENLMEHFKNVSVLIEGIQTGVNRAAAIVTSLSHYSRQDNLQFVECNIHDIINNCLIILNNQIQNRIDVYKDFSEFSHKIFGNESKLHQAFLNILSNAEQAIEKKGTIEIKTEISANYLFVVINDSGCGISKENLQKIFDPFFTTKDPGKGTGLGLSITYKIIQEHKGTIEYESQPGKGTKVLVKFPLH